MRRRLTGRLHGTRAPTSLPEPALGDTLRCVFGCRLIAVTGERGHDALVFRAAGRASYAATFVSVVALFSAGGGASKGGIAHQLCESTTSTVPALVGPYVYVGSNAASNVDTHWHAALGVYDCDHSMGDANGSAATCTWPAMTDQGYPARAGANVYEGLHSHEDGIIHMEPATADEAGRYATVGRYFEFGGWKLSAASFDFLGTTREDGDSCNGHKGVVSWALAKFDGDAKNPQNYVVQQGNPGDYKLYNGDVIVVAFLPKGESITHLGNPPSLANLPEALSGTATASVPSTAPAEPDLANLGPRIVAPTPEYEVSVRSDVHNGPSAPADFDRLTQVKGLAARSGFVAGYDVTFDTVDTSESVETSLLKFGSAAEATGFVNVLIKASAYGQLPRQQPYAEIPGAVEIDGTRATTDGFFDDVVIAQKGPMLMVIDYSNDRRSALPRPITTLITRQYTNL